MLAQIAEAKAATPAGYMQPGRTLAAVFGLFGLFFGGAGGENGREFVIIGSAGLGIHGVAEGGLGEGGDVFDASQLLQVADVGHSNNFIASLIKLI